MSERRSRNARWLLVLAPLPLFTTGALYTVPLGLMALLGVVCLVRDHRRLRFDPGARFVFWTFLGLWIPQLLALPGAAAPGRSLLTAAFYPTFPLAAMFLVARFGPGRQWGRFSLGVAAIVGIWTLDVIPGATGLIEWPLRPDDHRLIEGAVFARVTLGHLAAVLAPIAFEATRRHRREKPWLLLLPVALAAIVLLSGRRAAWLMLALATAAYGVHLYRTGRPPSRRITAAALPAVAVLGLLCWQHDGIRERIDFTRGLFTTDVEAIDRSTSFRLDIWETALAAAEDNWTNGIGTRAFESVYEEYAREDDYWLQEDRSGAAHPHLFVLEVAAETGVPGVVGYGVVLVLLVRVWRRSPSRPDGWTRPCGIALAVALLPLNVHAAFYGFRWSAVTWWLVGLTAAASGEPDGDGPSGEV